MSGHGSLPGQPGFSGSVSVVLTGTGVAAAAGIAATTARPIARMPMTNAPLRIAAPFDVDFHADEAREAHVDRPRGLPSTSPGAVHGPKRAGEGLPRRAMRAATWR